MAYLDTTAGTKRESMSSAVVAKTSAYTVTAADSGKILTSRGSAGAITFTLPTVTAALNGVDVTLVSVANQAMTIASQTTDQLVVLNDQTADSVAVSTASEIMGAAFRCVCDGTGWIVMPMLWETQTQTIVT